MKNQIEEIQTGYVCDENLRHIDVYFVGIEEGKTVAVIDQDTCKVIYFENELRYEPRVKEAIAEALVVVNKEAQRTGTGYVLPKEGGWGQMISIMERHGAIPGDWRHFMQDCDEQIQKLHIPEVVNCPHCGSDDIYTDAFEPEGCYVPVGCNSCDHEWRDTYKYMGIEEVSQVTSF